MEYVEEFRPPSNFLQELCATVSSPTLTSDMVSRLGASIWDQPPESQQMCYREDCTPRDAWCAKQPRSRSSSVPSPCCTINVDDGLKNPPYAALLAVGEKENSHGSAPTGDGMSANALSSLFSSDLTLTENLALNDDWDVFFPLKECWNNFSSQLPPTTSVGTRVDATDDPPTMVSLKSAGRSDPRSAYLQGPFFSLEEGGASEAIGALSVNPDTTYCSQGNVVEALIAQFAANTDSMPPVPRGEVPRHSTQLVSPLQPLFSEGAARGEKRGVAVTGQPSVHFMNNAADACKEFGGRDGALLPIAMAQHNQVPPFAICCAPIALPGVGDARVVNGQPHEFAQFLHRVEDAATRGGKGGIAPAGWHLARRPAYPLAFPLVNCGTLSDVYRDTPQDQELRRVINSNGPGGPLMSFEWPPRTRSCVIKMLRQTHAKVLLQHLRVVSFARRDVSGVARLFDTWTSKGIPPPGVMFGSYYYYTMSRCGKEMCLKHNGRERSGGFCRGCDYAQKGPNFRCRYQHACLFCLSDDHGWFDDTCCQRYVLLQQKMVELRMTDAVALALLDALETEDGPIRRKR